MKFGVVVFPGSTCDRDAFDFIREVMDQPVDYLWYQDRLPTDIDCVLLPGGFSYGDYLRPGAISGRAPIMKDVNRFAQESGLVVGICNGFQILLEAGLLPGALLRNQQLRFTCQVANVQVCNSNTPFTREISEGTVLKLPIAHGDGNYFVSDQELQTLLDNHQVVFRYTDDQGVPSDAANPNGSTNHIAGITNKAGNVLGMMPHPERAGEELLGSADGKLIFKSILSHWRDQYALNR